MYRAVFVAKNGEEMIAAEDAPTPEAAAEAAVAWARQEDLIGPEWPLVTEEAFVSALRIDRTLYCPYCAGEFYIDHEDLEIILGPGASDPDEWRPQVVADFLAEHFGHACWED